MPAFTISHDGIISVSRATPIPIVQSTFSRWLPSYTPVFHHLTCIARDYCAMIRMYGEVHELFEIRDDNFYRFDGYSIRPDFNRADKI